MQVKEGKKVKNAVGPIVSNYQISLEKDEIAIAGSLGWAKQKQMNPFNLIILRLVMLSIGRFYPNLIRKILQKILITGKNQAPFKFRRCLVWQDGHWQVRDELAADSWSNVVAAAIGGDQTSIYVVMSRTFQSGQLQPWLDLTERISNLSSGEALILERRLGNG